MTGRFEWHITCPAENAKLVRDICELAGVVFSQITGCPILGQGEYCYVTGYNTESEEARAEVDRMEIVLHEAGVPLLRSKIEDIVYDTKTGVNRI